MRKGEQTRAAILDTALGLASREGLEGITLGTLADLMQMSKSGVFAHFGSREDLQIAVLKEYEKRFAEEVLRPCLALPRGLPRLQAIFESWIQKTALEAAQGCIWISGATEYDDRPGSIRNELVGMVKSWQRELSRVIQQAIDEAHFETQEQDRREFVSDLVFDLYGIVLVLHHDARLLNTPDAVARARASFQRHLRLRTRLVGKPFETASHA